MSDWFVEDLVFKDGERYSMLTSKETGTPHFFATLWITKRCRTQMAVSTIKNKLNDLKILFEIETSMNRSFFDEFKNENFLKRDDVEYLRDELKKSVDHKNIQNLSRSNKSRNKVVSINDVHLVQENTQSVSKTTHYQRLTTTASYLTFLGEIAIQHKQDPFLLQELQDMRRLILKHRPKGLQSRNKSKHKSNQEIPRGLIDDFLSVADFKSELNPFLNEGIRVRNHVLFLVIRELGIRKGEALSLRLDCMEIFGDKPQIWVTRTHDDPLDNRATQPVAKTLERKLPISHELARMIQMYTKEYRSKIPFSNLHPYLFVVHRKCSTQGKPISISTFDQAVAKMKKVKPEFEFISPHLFRHNWNVELCEKVDKMNELNKSDPVKYPMVITPGKEAKIRAHLNGHASESSGDVYIKRHTVKEANKMQLIEQKRLSQLAKEARDSQKSKGN